MPQTSPMNWIILSLMMILSMLYIFSSINEKMNHNLISKMKFNSTVWSWNW